MLIEDLCAVGEILIILLLRQQGDIALVEDDGLHLVVIEGVHHGLGGLVLLGLDVPQAFLYGGNDLLGVLQIAVGQGAEGVARGVAQLLRLVLFHDDNGRHLLLHHDAGDLVQRRLHGVRRHSAVDHAR